MCPPEYFDVRYAINPWMDRARPVDTARALRQWEILRRTYRDLGHTVDVIPALPGLPDMVFAANGGLVIDGRAMSARFAHAERTAEGPAYLAWMRAAGLDAAEARHVTEGEGDFLPVGGGGEQGVREQAPQRRPAVRAERLRVVGDGLLVEHRERGVEVVEVRVDELERHHPAAEELLGLGVRRGGGAESGAGEHEAADAAVLGLNAVSDGRHVVLAAQATGLMGPLRERGFEPVPVDLTELLKAGGGIKCCTLELRS